MPIDAIPGVRRGGRTAHPSLVATLSLLGAIIFPLRAAEPVPIVRNVGEVLDATVIEGKAEGDQFCSGEGDPPALAVGDVTGDGIEDLAFIGSILRDGSGFSESYVLFGSRGLPARIDLAPSPSWGIRLHGTRRPSMPRAALGDLDGDGFDDVAFGPPWSETGPDAAVILFGAKDLPPSIDVDDFPGCRVAGIHLDPALKPDPRQTSRPHVPALDAGDVDGDGRRDLIVASSRVVQSEWGFPEGLVSIVFGSGAWPAEIHLAEVGASLRGCRLRWCSCGTCSSETRSSSRSPTPSAGSTRRKRSRARTRSADER